MSSGTDKGQCISCNKEKGTVKCEGCQQLFCSDHIIKHRQELNGQLDEIETDRDILRERLNEQINNPTQNLLIKQIDQWEEESIRKIQQTAEECRELLFQRISEYINKIEVNLEELTSQIKQIREKNNYDEMDLNQFKQKLTQLSKKIDQPPNVSIDQDSTLLINKISINVSSRSSSSLINKNTTWEQNGLTIAGEDKKGNELYQLHHPEGIYIDENSQCIYIADFYNHRILKWRLGENSGVLVAGGDKCKNERNRLVRPTAVVFDKNNDSLIICDHGNRRVIQWPLRNDIDPKILISNIDCYGLTMDNHGEFYVSNTEENVVRRYKIGDEHGILVAGGHGDGKNLNQLDSPKHIFVDQQYSLYISDFMNHRVMKWEKDATEGILVAGGQDKGNDITQLYHPQGLIVDLEGNIYVTDSLNNRVTRWMKESNESNIVVGGNGKGKQSNQFNEPRSLSFDREGNLYVADCKNSRIQKFNIH